MRDSCSSHRKGVAQAELLSPPFLWFLSLFLTPVVLRVAMAIGEVLHGPAAICGSVRRQSALLKARDLSRP